MWQVPLKVGRCFNRDRTCNGDERKSCLKAESRGGGQHYGSLVIEDLE